jgi:hypothetical protein
MNAGGAEASHLHVARPIFILPLADPMKTLAVHETDSAEGE